MIENERDAVRAAERRQAKDDGIVECMAKWGITLPRNAVEWRVASAKGELKGLGLCVQLLCTDGVVAWALTGDERPFFCHLSNFIEDKPEKVAAKPTKKTGGRRSVLLDAIFADLIA